MPMNSSSFHCMWSDRKSRLSLTRACEFFFLLSMTDLPLAGLDSLWTPARTVWTSGPILDLYWLVCEPLLDSG